MEYKGLLLDAFQEKAIAAIEQNHSAVVSAPTGSGKTLIADYIINRDVKKGIKVIYTAPIKALSNQKYKEFSAEYGKEKVGLLTGDIVINPGAPILIMTTEVYRNMALTDDRIISEISYVIFDEIHFINDIERGYVWEESIIFSKPHVRFLCLSATIPNAQQFANWIESIKKHKVDVIKHTKRPVPLQRLFYDAELGITTLDKIKAAAEIPDYKYVKGRSRSRGPRIRPPSHIELVSEIRDKLPCFFFNFSRKACQESAVQLAGKKIFKINPDISAKIREKLSTAPAEISNLKTTKILRQALPYGIGFHHAGLIPIVKELIEELFSMGLIKVLYTTETFAVGINMPAKTVCFASLRKFDGVNFRFLNSKEYFQIAGRAGRRGIDKQGYAYAMIDRRDFDYYQLKRMTDSDKDPIKSQFRLSVNTVLNLIKRHSMEEINRILTMNFHSYQKYGGANKKDVIFHKYDNITRKLAKMGYVENGKLTKKGEFSSRIYADEIIMGEIFATEVYKNLNEYHILMLVACLVYEARERVEFYNIFPSSFTKDLKKLIRNNDSLHDRRFYNIDKLTALIHPVYHSKNIFDVIRNTNLLEGDVIRLFRQILDRLGQIKDATDDSQLRAVVSSCQTVISDSMKDIDII